MMRHPIVPIVSVGLFLLAVHSPAAQQAAAPGARDLVGTWTLASAQRLGAGGEATPLANSRGLLIYDGAGHAFEVITRSGRAQYAAGQPTPAEALVTFANYNGFWGSYRAEPGRITYRPDGAVNPTQMGKDLPRSYEFKNGRLVVTSLPGETNGQGNIRWTWERVPPVENLSPTYRKVIGFWQHVIEQRVNLTTGAQISENRRAPSVIVYSPSGYVGVHFVPLNRKPFAAEIPTGDEAKAAIAGYVGYFGALTVYPNMVFHHQLATLGPGNGNTLKRPFELVGDEIHLTFPPTVNPQGQETTTLVTLKRISGEKEMLGN
ncbi:MAG: lipocalin-like domain-containing protein [Acidobacteriota bacterium]